MLLLPSILYLYYIQVWFEYTIHYSIVCCSWILWDICNILYRVCLFSLASRLPLSRLPLTYPYLVHGVCTCTECVPLFVHLDHMGTLGSGLFCILFGQVGGGGRVVGRGNELQSVHDLSLLGREFCSLCCRGLGWWLRRWGGKYLLLIGLKKAGVSC